LRVTEGLQDDGNGHYDKEDGLCLLRPEALLSPPYRGTMKRLKLYSAALVAVTIFALQVPAFAAGDSAAQQSKKHKETEQEREIRELREALKSQQEQIDALKAQMAGKDRQVTTAQQSAADAAAQASAAKQQADAASAAAAEASTKVDAVSSSVNDLKTTTAGLSETVIGTQKKFEDEIDSPSAIHYKGITITPVAFVAAEGVWRQHSVNSDVNTPFNSIPFPSASEGHVSELNFSGRQSRLGVYFQSSPGTMKLSGYYEMDFLGTGTSSNNNQSNSYVLRQRQIWGKVELAHGFAMTGGQMWSLVTEDRKGTDTKTEIQPQTIDAQYLVGYSWERQPGFRIQQRFGDLSTHAFTAAVSVEQAQITGFSASGTVPTDYFFGGPGQNGGLYNAAGNIGAGNVAGTAGITTYANNVAPDVIVKAALDYPKFHLEVGGIARFLRDYYLPVTAYGNNAGVPTYTYGTNYLNHTSSAGGVFGAARVYLGKFAEVGVQGMAGQGVGRYGSSQLADATLRPDETLEPIRNYHGLFSVETHPAPKLDIFAYYGGEYAQRTFYVVPGGSGALIGYAPPNLSNSGCYNSSAAVTTGGGSGGSLSATACGEPTKYIQEAMGGLTYRAYSSPKYGRLQYQLTYSYIQRQLWGGVTTGVTTPGSPRATEPMIHVSMRYYIP